MVPDRGDWLAIWMAAIGGMMALIAWGLVPAGPPLVWFVGGLASGASVATAFVAWRR